MTWDQVQRLKLESEGVRPENIDQALQAMHKEHTRLFNEHVFEKLPDWGKARPWGMLVFEGDEPLNIVRYAVARSVSGLTKPAANTLRHKAHSHAELRCVVDEDAAINAVDDNVSCIPILMARFQRNALKIKTCERETQAGVAAIYKHMSELLPGKAKYVRKIG